MFAAGAALTWLCLRDDTHQPTKPVSRTDPATEWRDLPERPWTDWLPHPDAYRALNEWDTEINGLPWGLAATFTPVDVRPHVDEQGALVWRIVGDRPSTAMIRRIVTQDTA